MLISTITSNIPFIQLSLMHRITEKICKERWQHWCTKISGVKVLPTLLISTITSNMSFIQLSLMLSGYPASSSVWGAGIAPVDLTTLSSLRACRTLKTEVKRKFLDVADRPSRGLRACRTLNFDRTKPDYGEKLR